MSLPLGCRLARDPYLADAAVHFQTHVDLGLVVEIVFPVVAMFLEARDGNAPDPAVRRRPNAGILAAIERWLGRRRPKFSHRNRA